MPDESTSRSRSTYARVAHDEMFPAIIDNLLERLPANGWPDVSVRHDPEPASRGFAHGVRELDVAGRVYRLELDEAPHSYEVVLTRDGAVVGSTYPRQAGDWESGGRLLTLILDDLGESSA